MQHFSRLYRCIAYSAGGFPPSEVPESAHRYSQDREREDILAVLDDLKIDRAHIVGCSMDAFAALHFGMQYCNRASKSGALWLTLDRLRLGRAPCRAPTIPGRLDCARSIDPAIRHGGLADTYGHGPARIQFLNKDPRGFAELATQLAEAIKDAARSCTSRATAWPPSTSPCWW